MLKVEELAAMIDHAIIDPNSTDADMHAGIDLALKYRTASFVTPPFRVKAARKRLDGTGLPLQTTVGVPARVRHDRNEGAGGSPSARRGRQ